MLLHHRGNGQLNSLKPLVQKIPDTSLNRLWIPQNVDGNRTLLAIARQASNPLVKAHRNPRHIYVDQLGTAFLKVDAFAAGYLRHWKAHLARVECIRSMLTRLADRLGHPRSLLQPIKPLVTVDECGRTRAELPMESVHDQCLGRLVRRKKQDWLFRSKILADHLKQALDLRVVANPAIKTVITGIAGQPVISRRSGQVLDTVERVDFNRVGNRQI